MHTVGIFPLPEHLVHVCSHMTVHVLVQCSVGSRGGPRVSMEWLDLVLRSTDDRLDGTLIKLLVWLTLACLS